MSLTALIVDDEPAARTKLRRLLSAEKDVTCVGEAATGDEAIRLIGELRPAVLFLDIEMPAPNGVAVLRAVRDEWQPLTVFTTAHAQYAAEAFALQAADYLLKPFGRERLTAAMERVRQLAGAPDGGAQQISALLKSTAGQCGPVERFLIKGHEKYVVVRSEEIVWAESAANYVVLHTGRGNHVLRRTLAQLETELAPALFFRVSRSAMVNLDAIAHVDLVGAGEHIVTLKDGTKVPLARSIRDLQDRLQAPKPR